MDEQATKMRMWLCEWFAVNAAGSVRGAGELDIEADTELVMLAFNLNKLAWELAQKFNERARS
jgi:hypothetical protein